MRKLALLTLLLAGRLDAACTEFFHNGPAINRYFVCALASDTATGAADGDMRYNKDTDLIQCYNGTVWGVCSTGGGAGSTPTGTGYYHVTGGVMDAAAVAPIPDSEGGTGSDTTVLAANRVFVTTGSAYSPFAIPDCDDTGGQHLNYDTTGPSFSCGTSGPSSGLTYAEVAAAVLGGL